VVVSDVGGGSSGSSGAVLRLVAPGRRERMRNGSGFVFVLSVNEL